MLKENISLLSLLLISFFIIASCERERDSSSSIETQVEKKDTSKTAEPKQRRQHQYGGWYCPDNFGFPPVNIQKFKSIAAIADRLPTKEETRNGSSLIFIDTAKYPNAKPLNINLPRVAKIYSKQRDITELIIVIQALEIGADSIVGFRYLNGGNGSAWLDEVTFLTEQEILEVGPTPFAYSISEMKSNTAQIWKAFCETEYAKNLAVKFDKKEFFESEWKDESVVHLELKSTDVKASGYIANVYGNLYLQIDYDYNGFHFSEKMLVSENKEENKTEVHFMAGPYPNDISLQEQKWTNWLQTIKLTSEKM